MLPKMADTSYRVGGAEDGTAISTVFNDNNDNAQYMGESFLGTVSMATMVYTSDWQLVGEALLQDDVGGSYENGGTFIAGQIDSALENMTMTTMESGNLTTHNLTSFTPLISLHYPIPVMIIVAVLLFMLTITTIFGNLLVGLALFKFRQLRTVSNYLIGNLAVSDFLLSTTILPLSAVYECLGHWVFGEAICYFWLCTDVLYCTSSIWNLCVIAFDRFTATIYPVWYREKRSNRQAAFYIGIVWVFSFAICVPPLLGWNDISQSYVFTEDTGVHQCMLFWTQSYVLYSASGSFFLPFLITTFLYIRIFVVLRRKMRKMRSSSRSHLQKRAKQEVAKQRQEQLADTVKKKADIELNQVNNKSTSGETEAGSSKSYFGTDSGGEDNEEEDSSAHIKSDHPLYVSSSEADVPAKIIRNGLREKGKEKDKETLVILNPHHFSDSEKDSDRDPVSVVVAHESTKPLNGDADKPKQLAQNAKNNNASISEADTEGATKKKGFGNMFKSGNPFRTRDKSTRSSLQQRRRIDQREVRATIRMAIIIACFCGCWLGFFVIYVVRSWCTPTCNIPRELDAFFFWLGYSNSSMNPILYAIFNEEFRRAFQKLLGCYKRKNMGMRR